MYKTEVWEVGDAYERYVGRWSRQVAASFLDWLALPADLRILDVGCGTGALVGAVLERASPASVVGLDPAEGFLSLARAQMTDPRARFEQGDAQCLPFEDGAFDAAVSGLALNFVPDARTAAVELCRVVRPGGTVALYVWDYAGEMQFMRRFWDAATALDPKAGPLDEGKRFTICAPEALAALLQDSGLERIETRFIDIPTVFADFDDYWSLSRRPGVCTRSCDVPGGAGARRTAGTPARGPSRRARRPDRPAGAGAGGSGTRVAIMSACSR